VFQYLRRLGVTVVVVLLLLVVVVVVVVGLTRVPRWMHLWSDCHAGQMTTTAETPTAKVAMRRARTFSKRLSGLYERNECKSIAVRRSGYVRVGECRFVWMRAWVWLTVSLVKPT
jgi:hypothetical protein